MSGAITVTLEQTRRDNADMIRSRIVCHDPKLFGHEAVFKLLLKVKVHESSGIDHDQVLHEHGFRLASTETFVEIPAAAMRAYSYSGKHISIEVHTCVSVDDSILFDTKVQQAHRLGIAWKPEMSDADESLVDPKDHFSFSANLKAIPPQNRLITLVLLVCGGLVVLLNMLLGIHDQFSPGGLTYFYDHSGSDGKSESPFLKALFLSGATGAGIWYAIRAQLRKYIQLTLKALPDKIRCSQSYRTSSLFTGKSRVPLQNVCLRLVACNMEKGQYRKRSGKKTKTVSFSRPARSVVLYDKTISHIPANYPVEQYFNENISFDPMFKALYPPCMTSNTHGLAVHWELQLLHPQFVDHQLDGDPGYFLYEDFVDPDANS